MSISVCWFRKDLRLNDNPAWSSACAAGPVIPIFVFEPSLLESSSQQKKDVLFSNLKALQIDLESIGGYLLTLNGPSIEVLPTLLSDWKATSLHFNKDHAPAAKERDKVISKSLNIEHHGYWGNLIHPPGAVVSGSGSVHKVFTPFYKKWVTIDKASGYDLPTANFHTQPRTSDPMPLIGETPTFATGSMGAYQRLEKFLMKISEYETDRDYPSIKGTSLLSSDLHFGTVGPREILDLVGHEAEHSASFIRQLAWRDWYAHLMDMSPEIVHSPANTVYKNIEWRNNVTDFDNWIRGETGYPIVDAGMRELKETGFMHNRVRMITGSFLVKHLLIDWRWGEKYFRHTLIDGDTSQNVGNWQWVAGTGFDAAPYFRIFNPIRQSEKFDKEGSYIRKWIPELSSLSTKQIHSPWEVNDEKLNEVGVQLGINYPYPIVDHSFARERCLEAYKTARAK
jgi:deoxyribodipyrimidine photo-lyase